LERAEGTIVAGRYRLLRKLGAGGMGSVWLAHDLLLDSSCALKLIDGEKAQSDEVRLRFEREAKAAAQLRGAHVVDVFDHGEWEGTLYIAMEYLQGEDLGARLDRVGRLDRETTYRIVAHVARALVRAHAHGIVHRDLKPENIFLVEDDGEEVAKVLDFGIAKHDAYSLHDKATRTGSFLGTPFYVSPEQARGKSTDYRSDLWSLGIIVFQCLTGHPPFESEALGELMGLILYEDVPRLTARNPELPPAVDAWWEKAAARDREQRFQSAKELSDALAHALGIQKLISVPATPPRRPSLADVSGSYSSALRSGSYPPVSILPADGATHEQLPSFSDPGWSEELVGTGAPVYQTGQFPSGRFADISAIRRVPARLRSFFSREGLARSVSTLRALSKRDLAALAVGSGVLIGVFVTLAIGRDDAHGARLELRPARPATPLTVERRTPVEPPPTVAPIQQPTTAPSAASSSTEVTGTAEPAGSMAATGAEGASSGTAAPSASAPPLVVPSARASASSEPTNSTEVKRRPAPAPKRRVIVRGPDYGI
jgi:serine/threonine-protein kinase